MKALVFSGGGAKIHYHVGAARTLLSTNDYTLFAGVSAGAIVAAYLAQFRRGAEAQAVHQLQMMTRTMTEEQVFESWPLGRLQGLWQTSFYNSDPLRELLQRELDPVAVQKSGRLLRIGAVALENSKFAMFTEQCQDLRAAVLASSAFPGFFEPVQIGEHTFVDGGVRTYTPINAAIQAGATDIDVVITSPSDPNPMPMKKRNALHIMLRALDIMADEISDKDVRLAEMHNELILAGAHSDKKLIKLRIIRPKTELRIDTWDFGSKDAGRVRERGALDALRVLQA